MKPMVKALIACGLLAALIGVFFLSKNWQGQQEEAEPTPDNQTLLLADTPVVQAVLQNANGEITLLKEDDNWTIREHTYARLLSSSISSIAGSLKGLKSTETVTSVNSASLSEFGLQPPQGTVTVTHEDGMREVLLIGAKNPSANSYYAMVEGGSDVVLISGYTADRLLYGYHDFRDTTLPAVDTAGVEEIWIQNERETIHLSSRVEMPRETYSFSLLKMLEPYPGRDTASDKLQTRIYEVIPNLVINGFVEDNAQDLTPYGLDKPTLELRVEDAQGAALHLLFGKDAPEGNIYCMLADEPHVYTMQKSLAESLLTVTGFDVADRFIIIFNIADVDTLRIQDGNRLWELSLRRTPQEGKDEDLEEYFLDGIQQEEKPFKDLYETTISIMGDAPLDNSYVPGTPADVTVTFFFNTGKEPAVMNLYPYDDNFYAAERDGKMQFLTSRRYMDTLRQKLQALSGT